MTLPAALLLLAAGCSGGEGEQAAEGPPETPNVPLTIEPLSDVELMGVPREQVLLTLPWSQQVVSRDPAPAAARATLQDVEVLQGPDFDRTVFEFGTDTDFPGYRIVWDDTTNARCGEGEAADAGEGRTLLVRIRPASARRDEAGKTTRTITDTSRRPGYPSISIARQLCDEADDVVWALGAADSTLFRVVEMHTPPRLVVDLAHPGRARAAGLTGAAPSDSAAAPR